MIVLGASDRTLLIGSRFGPGDGPLESTSRPPGARPPAGWAFVYVFSGNCEFP